MGQPAPEDPVNCLFLDYENSKSTFRRRLNRLAKYIPGWSSEAEGRIKYLREDMMPVHELRRVLRTYVKDNDIGLLVIDSAVPALGGAPEDSTVVSRFFSSLNSLGVTVLVICHETKAEAHLYPFGSIFFHNLARNIWNVRKEQEDGQSTMRVGLFHTKPNEDKKYPPCGLLYRFDEEGGTEITPEALGASQTVREQVLTSLSSGPKTLTELYALIPGRATDAIRKAAHREVEQGVLMSPKRGTYILKRVTSDNAVTKAREQMSKTEEIPFGNGTNPDL